MVTRHVRAAQDRTPTQFATNLTPSRLLRLMMIDGLGLLHGDQIGHRPSRPYRLRTAAELTDEHRRRLGAETVG